MTQSDKKKHILLTPTLTASALAKEVYTDINPELGFYEQPFWLNLSKLFEQSDYKLSHYPIIFQAGEEILKTYSLNLGAKTLTIDFSKKNKSYILNFLISCVNHKNQKNEQSEEFIKMLENSVEIKKLFINNSSLIKYIYKEEKNEEALIGLLNLKAIENKKLELLQDYEILYLAHKNDHTTAQKLILSFMIEHHKQSAKFEELEKVVLVIAGQTSSDELKGKYFYREKRQSKAQMIVDMLEANLFFKMAPPISWQERAKKQVDSSWGLGEEANEALYIGALFYLFTSDLALPEHIKKILTFTQNNNALLYKFFIEIFSKNAFLTSLKKETSYISLDYEKLNELFKAGKFEGAQICTIVTKLADCYDRFHNKPHDSSHYLYMMASLIKTISSMGIEGDKASLDFFNMHPRFLSFLSTQEVKKNNSQTDFFMNMDLFYAYLFSIDKSMPMSSKALSHWEDATKNIVLKIIELPIIISHMKKYPNISTAYKEKPSESVQKLIDRVIDIVNIDFLRQEMKSDLFFALIKNIKEWPYHVDLYQERDDGENSYAHIITSVLRGLQKPELIESCLVAIETLESSRQSDKDNVDKIYNFKQSVKSQLEQIKIKNAMDEIDEPTKEVSSNAEKFKI